MTTARPQLITTEDNTNLPILIIDKNGIIGEGLAELLKDQFLIVIVSNNKPAFHENIIHIPYKRKIPVIPDNKYSHVFVFYNGESETLSILPSLVKKANESSGKIYLLTPLSVTSYDLDKRLSNHLYHSMPTIIYGEVFDRNQKIPNLVNYFIYQAKKFGRLEMPNEGLGKLYPVHVDDLLAVIVAIAFSHEQKKGYQFAFPRVPFTEMSVARIFQRIDPEIKIDFIRKKIKIPNYHMPTEGEYIFSKYNLEEGLRRIIKNVEADTARDAKRGLAIKPSKRNFSYKKYFLVLLAALILPIIMILTSALIGSAMLFYSVASASDGSFGRARSMSESAHSSFSFSRKLSEGYFPADYIVSDLKNNLIERVKAGEDAAGIGSRLFLTLETFSDIYNEGANTKEVGERFIESLADTKNALLLLEEMRAEKSFTPSIASQIDDKDFFLNLLENTIDTIPDLLGFEGKREYLLLFQNNMEIRPGGGFIGSYGIFSVENGKFGKIEIHDVYDADGKLTTHVEPPFALRRYLGAAHWFLRDSNFSIEGSTNAEAAADLLKRSIGQDVDGVLAVDTEFIKNILEDFGPVEVADYNETVSADNFYLLTQKHAEENFFPGSTQKKDFLRSLLSSILARLSEDKTNSAHALVEIVERSIKEKHLMIVPLNPKAQSIFVVNNLTGDIVDERRATKNEMLDFLGVIDANIGANKGNYYVNRSVTHTASISDSGQLFGEAVVTFENTSKSDSIFGGDYKNYMRVILPSGSDIRAIVIDDQQMVLADPVTNPAEFSAPGFIPPAGLEVDKSEVESKDVFSFFVEVPIQTSKKVSVNYAVPQAVDLNEPSALYSLRVFKQPGTIDDPYRLFLNYPSKFMPVEASEGVVDLGGKLRFDTALTTDRDIVVKFSQK